MRRIALVAFALSLPTLAMARPAVVRVFEAKLHTKAEATSEVVGVLVEGQRLSVSEDAEDGWRRVRLADGGTAWVRDDALFLDAQLPTGPAQPGAAAASAVGGTVAPPQGAAPTMALPTPGMAVALPAGSGPPEQPALWVDELAELRVAVAQEPALVAEVDRLERMQTYADWVFWGGLSTGIGLAVVPAAVAIIQDTKPQGGWYYGGAGVLLATQMLAWGLSVGEGDMAAVAKRYNKKHPEPRIQIGTEPAPEED
ncbi:MAG: SH3 domain-containing protein [Myxococcales bacterium]|nr:SH3 domain-containing protein [Myxococcales bacterium]MCB9526033.1 SH3 domain-containing protein [Myxococcales bacterium]